MKKRYTEFKELNLIKNKLENISNKYCITFLEIIYRLILNEKILINFSDIAYEFYLFQKENKNFSVSVNESGIYHIFFISDNFNSDFDNYVKYVDFDKLEFILKPKYSIFNIDSLVNFFYFLRDFLDLKSKIKTKLLNTNALSTFKNLANFIRSSDFKELYYFLDNSIDLRGYIKDSATSKLKEIRNEIRNLNNLIPLKLKEFIDKNEQYLNSRDITLRNNRYVILLNNQYINFLDGIIQDYSSTHKTAFFEPNFIIPFNNRLTMLISLEQEEIQKILINIYNQITKDLNNLNKAFKIVSVLSFLENYYKLSNVFSKCSYDDKNKDNKIEIKGLINPIVKDCVEVDFYLNKKAILITAPNASGKTTLMKSLVLASIFNNLDLLVFCKYCRFPKFDKIFFEFSDFQDLEANLSTFSSHVSYWNEIISYLESKAKDERVLIILDEGVSGTNPLQAAALTISLINEFLKYDNVYIIFSTHYDEVKEHILNNSLEIEYASIDFDYQNLQSRYKLIYNTFANSLGIEIAAKLGLKNQIITNAYEILNKLIQNNFKDSAYAFSEYIKKINEYNITISNLKKKEEELNNEFKKIEDLKATIIKDAYKNAYFKAYNEIKEVFTNKVKELVDSWEKELNSLKSKNKLDKIESKLKSIKNYDLAYINDAENIIDNIDNKDINKVINEGVNIGDVVFVNSLNLEAEVIDILKNKVLVKSDGINYQVDKSDIKILRKKDKLSNEINKKLSRSYKNIDKNKDYYEDYSVYEISIRGDSYLEAKKKIDEFIRTSFLAKLRRVKIIHGKGQVLSKMVWDYLRDLKRKNLMVKDFYFADEREGSFGVTIVELLD